MFRRAKSANRCERFREGTGDKVDLVEHALRFRYAAACRAKHAVTMGFVNIEIAAVTMRNIEELINRGNVTKHGIHAFDHNQRMAAFNLALAAQALIQIFGAIVTKAYRRGAG